MTQQPYAPTAPAQPDAAPGYQGQHETTALPRVPQGYAGAAPGYAPDAAFAPGYAPVNHEAALWQEKFARQRARTRVAVVVAALASVAALVLGVATWQLANNSLFGSSASIAAGLGSGDLNLDELVPGATPEGALPEGTTPDGSAPGATTPGGDLPLSELPLPDSLKSLAATVGITDVGQLLDLAVANGMMSQSDADQLRAALVLGAGQAAAQ